MECGVENLGLYTLLLFILLIPANDLEYLDAFFPNCSIPTPEGGGIWKIKKRGWKYGPGVGLLKRGGWSLVP